MKSLMQTAKEDLEKVLDEGFPKIHEEGPAKIANKRGPALALYAEAICIMHKITIAFGRCEFCYGKGYGTETTFIDGGYGSKEFRKKMPSLKLCTCDRGKQLGEILEKEFGHD